MFFVSAHSVCVVHPKLPLAGSLPTATLAHGQRASVSWTAGASAARPRFRTHGNFSHHGYFSSARKAPSPLRSAGAVQNRPPQTAFGRVFAEGHPGARPPNSRVAAFGRKPPSKISGTIAALCRDAATPASGFGVRGHVRALVRRDMSRRGKRQHVAALQKRYHAIALHVKNRRAQSGGRS